MVWIGVPILLLVEGVEGGDELCSPILPVVDPADELCSVAPPEVSGLPDGDEVSAANTGVRPIANAATINANTGHVISLLSIVHNASVRNWSGLISL